MDDDFVYSELATLVALYVNEHSPKEITCAYCLQEGNGIPLIINGYSYDICKECIKNVGKVTIDISVEISEIIVEQQLPVYMVNIWKNIDGVLLPFDKAEVGPVFQDDITIPKQRICEQLYGIYAIAASLL